MTNIKVEFEEIKFIRLMESHQTHRSYEFVSRMHENQDGSISLDGLGFDLEPEGVNMWSPTMEDLKRFETEAIEKEDYISAAKFRDQIIELENK